MKLKIFIFGLFFVPLSVLFFPLSTSATSWTLDCADSYSTGGSAPSCTGDTFTFGGSPSSVTDNITPNIPYPTGQVLYISYIASTNCSGTCYIGFYDGGAYVTNPIVAGTFSEIEIDTAGITSNTAFTFRHDSSGTISAICVDDDGYSCSGEPPEDPPPSGDGFLNPLYSTSTDNQLLGGINFGIAILIVIASIYLVAYIYNTYNKKKKPWA